MRLTYEELTMGTEALSQLMDRDDIPFNTALKISKNAIEINNHLVHYQQEREKLYEEYMEKNPETGEFVTEKIPGDDRVGLKIKEGKIDDFKKKTNELLKFEVDIDLRMINASELSEIKISPKLLAGVMFMIEEV